MSTLVVVHMRPFSLVGAIWFVEIQGAPKTHPDEPKWNTPCIGFSTWILMFHERTGHGQISGDILTATPSHP
jgi:hypothetical protein